LELDSSAVPSLNHGIFNAPPWPSLKKVRGCLQERRFRKVGLRMASSVFSFVLLIKGFNAERFPKFAHC
jgi:hypothetical protein